MLIDKVISVSGSFCDWQQINRHRQLKEESMRWGLSFVSVLLATGGVIWWVSRLPQPVVAVAEPPPAAIAIDMTPEPVSTQSQTQDIPLGPQQTLSEPDPSPVEPPKITAASSPAPNPPVPVPKPEKVRKVVKPHKPVLPQKKVLPDNSQPAEMTTAPPRSDAPVAQAHSAASSGASSPKAAHDPVTWQGALLAQLERVKRYPQEAMADHDEGVPTVTFTMDRLGHVLSVRLNKSSGHPLLDAEAVALPKRAQPLPVPPDSIPGNPITLTVPVEFYIR